MAFTACWLLYKIASLHSKLERGETEWSTAACRQAPPPLGEMARVFQEHIAKYATSLEVLRQI